jgi:hypothetical protein
VGHPDDKAEEDDDYQQRGSMPPDPLWLRRLRR